MQWARGNQGQNFQIFFSIRSWEEEHLINCIALWVLTSASQEIWYIAAKSGPAREVPNNLTLVTTRKTRRSADMRARLWPCMARQGFDLAWQGRLLTLYGKAGFWPCMARQGFLQCRTSICQLRFYVLEFPLLSFTTFKCIIIIPFGCISLSHICL